MSLAKPTHLGYFYAQSVVALAEGLRAGSLTCVELTQAALDSIERLNPTLNAFVQVDAPVALAQASTARPMPSPTTASTSLSSAPVARVCARRSAPRRRA